MKLLIGLIVLVSFQAVWANENDMFNGSFDSNNQSADNHDNSGASYGSFDPNDQSRNPSSYNEGYEDTANPNSSFDPE